MLEGYIKILRKSKPAVETGVRRRHAFPDGQFSTVAAPLGTRIRAIRAAYLSIPCYHLTLGASLWSNRTYEATTRCSGVFEVATLIFCLT